MVRLVVVHDLFGTLFSLTSPIEEFRAIFAEQLEGNGGARPILAELVIMDWFHATQRDFTYLSMNDAYQPIAGVFKATLPRVLLQAGVLPPDQYKGESLAKAGAGIPIPGNENPFPAEITDRLMASLQKLKPRPGMVEAFSKTYRSKELVPKGVDQVELWAATNGGNALGDKLLKAALGEDVGIYTGSDVSSKQRPSSSGGGDDVNLGHGVGLFSCDEVKLSKPNPKVYSAIRERIDKDEEKEQPSLWFVASHTWDLFAAKKAGFKTAWVGYEEFYTCPDIYDKPDIVATDLDDVANQILKWEHGQA